MRATQLLTYAALALLAGLAAAAIPAVFHTFDISDEGIYLYSLIQPQNTTFLSPFYVLFHLWGDLFGQTLVAYRLLGLISALAISALAGYVVHRAAGLEDSARPFFIAAAASGGFAQFVFTMTFSYNSCAMLGAGLWACGLLLMGDAKTTRAGAALAAIVAALGVFLGLLGRPPCGVALLILTPVLMAVGAGLAQIRYRARDSVIMAAVFIACAAVFSLAYGDVLARILRIYPAYLAASHTNVIASHLSNLLNALEHNLLLVAYVAFAVFHREKKTRHGRFILRAAAFPVALMTLYPLLRNLGRAEAYKISLHGATIFFACGILLCLFCLWNYWRRREDARPLYLTLVCITAAIASGLGTNSALLGQVGGMAVWLALPLLAFAWGRPRAAAALWALMGVVTAGILVSALYLHPFRALPPSAQTAYAAQSDALAGVRLDPQLAQTVDALADALRAAGFDARSDRIMAFPDLPGLIVAAGAQAFGTPWMITAYPHSDGVNCAYIGLEPVGGVNRVYFLLNGEPGPELAACLDSRLKKAPGFAARLITPDFYNRRNETTAPLRLQGPYNLY